jgi:hypothetical protein
MALTPFFGGNGRNSILDPFDLGFWDPEDTWPSSFFGRNVGRDVQAVASTRIDWVETPEAHVFKADLPGKQLSYLVAAICLKIVCIEEHVDCTVEVFLAMERIVLLA